VLTATETITNVLKPRLNPLCPRNEIPPGISAKAPGALATKTALQFRRSFLAVFFAQEPQIHVPFSILGTGNWANELVWSSALKIDLIGLFFSDPERPHIDVRVSLKLTEVYI
jgi:hypothetical protein